MAVGDLRGRDPLVVAGIDPGTWCMGFGVVARHGEEILAVDHGTFRAPRSLPVADRLYALFGRVSALLEHHRPDVVSLEQAFVQKNVQSALRLGEARATVLVAARARGVAVVEYPTAVAKKSVTGHGGAGKDLVREMVARELGLPEPPESADAADALALALCLLRDPLLDPRFHAAAAAPDG